jgi:predicted phosphodiesterase
VTRIGLASDSFGNVDALRVALDLLARAGADQVFFTGGWWADVDAVLARRRYGDPGRLPPPDGQGFLSAVEGALTHAASVPEHPLAGRIVRVASRTCPEYGAGAPTKLVDMVEGHICCLVHDKAELSRDDIANASLIFHGNSDRAALVRIGPRIFVTPGHLRAAEEEGKPASFALVDVGPAEIEIAVFSAEGAELLRERAAFGTGGKVSVR